jgi:hypothetical protein
MNKIIYLIIKVNPTKIVHKKVKISKRAHYRAINLYAKNIWNNLLIYSAINALVTNYAIPVYHINTPNIKYYNLIPNLRW